MKGKEVLKKLRRKYGFRKSDEFSLYSRKYDLRLKITFPVDEYEKQDEVDEIAFLLTEQWIMDEIRKKNQGKTKWKTWKRIRKRLKKLI